MKKAYIAGAITKDQAHYKQRFKAAENYLTALGYEVFNPANDVGNPTFCAYEWTNCMKRDVKMLMDTDMVYFIPNWRQSKGAQIEMQLCKWFDIPYVILSWKTQNFIEREYLK